jgi:hypothetical protein
VTGGVEEIVPSEVRKSATTSQSIGVTELAAVLAAVPADAEAEAYRQVIVEGNVLGLDTETGRTWRHKTLTRLYKLDPGSVLFRGLRDLWELDAEARPLLAGLAAMARDTVFRATASLIDDLPYGHAVSTGDFAAALNEAFPGAYQENTAKTIARKASMSWEQTGHLRPVRAGLRERVQAVCAPTNVAYALLLGHLQGHRGEALFETIWARVLDRPRSQLLDLAVAASQQGMVEFRSGGGVIEVGFSQLLRPMEGQLL